MESKAIGMFGIRSKVLGFSAVTVALCLGVGIYLNTDGGNSDKPQNSKLASLLKGPSAMQPLPEMPSEPMPNISAMPSEQFPRVTSSHRSMNRRTHLSQLVTCFDLTTKASDKLC